MGCHNLPWDLGRRQGIPRLHRVCTLCAGENPGDEQHVVFECPGLQDIRDRYQNLFGEHAATMLQFMWQDDIRGVASLSKNAWEYIMALTLMGVRHLINPRWLEEM